MWLLLGPDAGAVLEAAVASPTAAAAWPMLLPAANVQYHVVAHWVALILQAELPLVAGALRLAGFSASRVCLQWLSQCFWNVLDAAHIFSYLGTAVTEGPASPVFFCVALFRHMQADILVAAQQQRVGDVLLTRAVTFTLANHVDFVASLCDKYSPSICEHYAQHIGQK